MQKAEDEVESESTDKEVNVVIDELIAKGIGKRERSKRGRFEEAQQGMKRL